MTLNVARAKAREWLAHISNGIDPKVAAPLRNLEQYTATKALEFLRQGIEPVCYLYRHFHPNGDLLYVGISLAPLSRQDHHVKAADWRNLIHRIIVEPFATREEALEAEQFAIRAEFPKFNIVHNTRRHPNQELTRWATSSRPEPLEPSRGAAPTPAPALISGQAADVHAKPNGSTVPTEVERTTKMQSLASDDLGRQLLDYQALRERGFPWSRVQLACLEAIGKFPRHINPGGNTIAWFEDEIDDFLEAKAAERDAKVDQLGIPESAATAKQDVDLQPPSSKDVTDQQRIIRELSEKLRAARKDSSEAPS
jgi:hypothetical protein